MNILIIQPWIRSGGAELISVHLADHLQRHGHTVSIACTFVDLRGLPLEASSLTYHLPYGPLARLCQRSRPFFLVFGFWLLLALVWKSSKDVEILNPHNFPAAWIAVIIGFTRRIRILWTCNEPPERLFWRDGLKVGLGDFLGWRLASSWIDKFLMKRVDAIYVPSEKTRQQVQDRYARSATVIRIGLEANHFTNRDYESSYGLALEQNFVLLSVGKLHPQKNQVICLDAMRLILPRIPNAILVLAGDGPMMRQWKELAQKLGIESRVKFLGSIYGQELRDLYAACDVNLFAATNQSWGLTPFEALSVGRISIVSRECGASEVISREEIGIVTAPTGEAFSRSIIDVYENHETYQRMAAKGRDYVRQNITWEGYAFEVLHMLSRINSQSRRANLSSVPDQEISI